jgi:hypothetical protein
MSSIILPRLCPSYIVVDDNHWRPDFRSISSKEWKELRLLVLQRDNFTCQFCGFESVYFQIIHHIDGNVQNNSFINLATVCPMCNLIIHANIGCEVVRIVDLYKHSYKSQIEIIRITRRLRALGEADKNIRKILGVKNRVPFKNNKSYLTRLFGFITARKTPTWIQTALEYCYKTEKQKLTNIE